MITAVRCLCSSFSAHSRHIIYSYVAASCIHAPQRYGLELVFGVIVWVIRDRVSVKVMGRIYGYPHERQQSR